MRHPRIWIFHIFFIALTLFSFRHLFIPGDHLWTGEGARMSWSMRLKGKTCKYSIKKGNDEWNALSFNQLIPWQSANMDDPYLFYSYIKQTHCLDGNPVYGKMECRAISRNPNQLIDPNTNLCNASYAVLAHNSWISPYPGSWDPFYRWWFQNRNVRISKWKISF